MLNVDSASPALRDIHFQTAGTPRQMSTLPDANGNGYPELAVLQMDVRPNQGAVQIRDALSGSAIVRFTFPTEDRVFRGMVPIADVNGNGSPELVVLLQHKGSSRSTALVRDGRTGRPIRSIDFSF